MYGTGTSGIGDFLFGFDDYLLVKLLKPSDFKSIDAERFEILRANIRSEVLYSTELHSVLEKKVNEFERSISGIGHVIDIGIGDFTAGPMYGAGLAGDKFGGVGRGRFGFKPNMYTDNGGFGFDDVIIDKFLPAQRAASLNPTQLRVLSSMIKSEILFSDEVEKILTPKIQDTLRDLEKKA